MTETAADLLAFALGLADEADAVALRGYRGGATPERKADGTFVTPADREIEALLRERIASRFPRHAVLGEEAGEAAGEGGGARWIVDPIDGTHNYMRGIPVWATLIACERGGAVELGVVSAPALGARWHASRGGGAWRTPIKGGRAGAPERIAASDAASIAEAHALYGEPAATLDRWPGAEALLRAAWRARGFGDFWGFCLVAEGAADLMIEGADLHPWDLAALVPIVEEAGAVLTGAGGAPSPRGGPCLAAAPRLHAEALRLLGRAAP